MSNDEQLIFMKNGKSLPIKCEKIKYYEDEELLSRSKITPVAVPMMQFN
jgi:type IV secretory pathway TraG/TraD family ATPase VirD4